MSDLSALPRDWLLADLAVMRTAELKHCISQAAQWGFDEPHGLTNNGKRITWLRGLRGPVWDMLQAGRASPAPRQAHPKIVKPGNRRPRSLCRITASEVNDFLATLPVPEPV